MVEAQLEYAVTVIPAAAIWTHIKVTISCGHEDVSLLI
jgi:hypothetical protein